MAGDRLNRGLHPVNLRLLLVMLLVGLLISCGGGGSGRSNPTPSNSTPLIPPISLQMVSLSTTGAVANNSASAISVSNTGRFVFFQSAADNLVPGDIHNTGIFVRATCVGVVNCSPSTTPVKAAVP